MPPPENLIDPRGPRFAAAVTTVVLAVVVITASAWLAAAQTVVFAVGAFAGPRFSPYGLLYARFVRPRLAPPSEWEDERPPRFAQAVGFAFLLVSTIGYAAGVPVLGAVAAVFGLIAAFLNAAFGICLGCELYLIIRRLTDRRPAAS